MNKPVKLTIISGIMSTKIYDEHKHLLLEDNPIKGVFNPLAAQFAFQIMMQINQESVLVKGNYEIDMDFQIVIHHITIEEDLLDLLLQIPKLKI